MIPAFTFEFPTIIEFGVGKASEIMKAVEREKADKVVLVTDPVLASIGMLDPIRKILEENGIAYTVYQDIRQNPLSSQVDACGKLCAEFGAKLIIAVGGGSVMDCCKAISMAAVYDGDIWADFWARPGIIQFDPLPLGVIVTVAGTGSEMNGGAVITNEALKIKTGRDYPKCNPKFALLDPTYTYSVPKKQLVSGSFDILSHIMEIYFSEPNEDNVSDDIAEALMRSVIRNLRAAIQNPQDYTARSNLMWDATMAENRILKLGKRTDFQCHQMEHQLAAYTGCNHGAGLAVLHPVYYRHIYQDGLSKFQKFAVHVWGISPQDKTEEKLARAGVEALADFIKEIGLPSTLGELGVDESIDLKAIADSCNLAPGSYRKMTHEEILKIFQECH